MFLPPLEMQFDAIFHDPFSHTKNQELWSVDFFQVLFAKLKQDGRIATYSVATPVRAGLKKAGFHLSDGPSTPTKRATTVATKSPSRNPIDKKQENKLETSPYAVPYRDPTLSCTREQIKKDREKRILEQLHRFGEMKRRK